MVEQSVPKKRGRKYLIRCFAFLGIYEVMFFSFLLFNITVPRGVSKSKPFLSFVDEIAADGEYVYTLDTTFCSVCKYKNNGEFVFRIRFSGLEGTSSIFCDKKGNLCRVTVVNQEFIVYAYDESGNIVDQYPVNRKKLPGGQREQKVGTTEYSLHTHVLNNSTITIKDGNETSEFVIEGIACHLVQGLYMIVMLGFAGIGAINLIKYIGIQEKSKLRIKNR